ncbi:unnamed protein product [Prunus armeniaca]|uniref:Uncharacterized protein n=1 Tax=Prunus armeniaca TaxID=36596 RepID=A0A6J5WPV6_PRUAR|nr:unnamed protein product [Prunus armeniaca]CAB4302067.1 unnamed protein product [Prunus armeniaca]
MVDGGIFLEPMHNPCPKLQVTSRIQLSPVAESKWGNSWNAHVFPLPCYEIQREREQTQQHKHILLSKSRFSGHRSRISRNSCLFRVLLCFLETASSGSSKFVWLLRSMPSSVAKESHRHETHVIKILLLLNKVACLEGD